MLSFDSNHRTNRKGDNKCDNNNEMEYDTVTNDMDHDDDDGIGNSNDSRYRNATGDHDDEGWSTSVRGKNSSTDAVVAAAAATTTATTPITAVGVEETKPPPSRVVASGERPGDSSKAKSSTTNNKKKKTRRKKAKDMPKRPLSAYNLFFADERQRLINVGSRRLVGGGGGDDGVEDDLTSSVSDSDLLLSSASAARNPRPQHEERLGFAGLARVVAAKWKTIDSTLKEKYESRAAQEQIRYKKQILEYNAQKNSSNRGLVGQRTEGTEGAGGAELGQDRPRSEVGSQYTGTTIQSSAAGRSNGGLNSAGLHGLVSVWPSNQQTIANLGLMYTNTADRVDGQPWMATLPQLDSRTIDAGRSSSFVRAAANQPNMKSANGGGPNRLLPRQSLHLQNEAIPQSNKEAVTNAYNSSSEMVHWGSASVPTGSNSTAQMPASMSNTMNMRPSNIAHSFLNDTSQLLLPGRPESQLEKRLSDPVGIQRLAAELDDDQLDVLRTLHEQQDGTR